MKRLKDILTEALINSKVKHIDLDERAVDMYEKAIQLEIDYLNQDYDAQDALERAATAADYFAYFYYETVTRAGISHLSHKQKNDCEGFEVTYKELKEFYQYPEFRQAFINVSNIKELKFEKNVSEALVSNKVATENISVDKFAEWIKNYIKEHNVKQLYLEYCGVGSMHMTKFYIAVIQENDKNYRETFNISEKLEHLIDTYLADAYFDNLVGIKEFMEAFTEVTKIKVKF